LDSSSEGYKKISRHQIHFCFVLFCLEVRTDLFLC